MTLSARFHSMFVTYVQSKSSQLSSTHAGFIRGFDFFFFPPELSARVLISPCLFNEILSMFTASDQLSGAFTVSLCLESIRFTLAHTV